MEEPRFLFLEGNPAWLDFVNTRFMLGDRLVDRMETWPDLVDWLRAASLLDSGKDEAGARSWNGREALHRARKLRVALHDAAEQVRNKGPFPGSAVRLLNGILESAPGVHRLIPDPAGFRLRYEAAPKKAADLLEPLARSAADFLTRAELGRIRKCENHKCVLYFYDSTKNRGRRWCSMALCGNRMKAAAHYQRKREREQ